MMIGTNGTGNLITHANQNIQGKHESLKKKILNSPDQPADFFTPTTTSILTSTATISGSAETVTTTTTSTTCSAQPTVHRTESSEEELTASVGIATPNPQLNCDFGFSLLCLSCTKKLDRKNKAKSIYSFYRQSDKNKTIEAVKINSHEEAERIIRRIIMDFNLNPNPGSYHKNCYSKFTIAGLFLLHKISKLFQYYH